MKNSLSKLGSQLEEVFVALFHIREAGLLKERECHLLCDLENFIYIFFFTCFIISQEENIVFEVLFCLFFRS